MRDSRSEPRHTMCDAVQAELGALLDDELPEQLAAEVGKHTERCAACGAALTQLRALWDRVRALRLSSPGAPESLRLRVRGAVSPRQDD